MQRGEVACGVAVVVTWRRQVLFGRRPTADGGSEWQLPGGWIETGESPEAAARREVGEETGLGLGALRFVGITNNVFSAREHSISLYFEAECRDASELTRNAEARRVVWEWRDWDAIEGDTFLPLGLLRQTDYRPFAGSNFPAQFSF